LPKSSDLKSTGFENSAASLTLLSQALLSTGDGSEMIASSSGRTFAELNFEALWDLANSHHVILRAFPRMRHVIATEATEQTDSARLIDTQLIDQAIANERARIANALLFLAEICGELRSVGDVVVIKSLDHWPDLGNDIDLYTNAASSDVVATMSKRFDAPLAERSLGDRLANKWNFVVPGLPELVEVHVGRLGQTGEQVSIADSLITRASEKQFGEHRFVVPAPEDRVMISTLQRMYRHFYLRLCDVVNIGRLIESSAIDYSYLRFLARSAGLWDGVANYLAIVSEYVRSYRGDGLALPYSVTRAAKFGNARLTFRRKFLRVPIFPHAASFYLSEWKKLLFSGEIQNALRLSLLPGLAVAAALEFKITGNDKGVW
jgi:hypothetical protein